MRHDRGDRWITTRTSRRSLLTALAMTGVTALLPGKGGAAQAVPATRSLIDTHHHYYPAEIVDGWQDYLTRHGNGKLTPAVAQWTQRAHSTRWTRAALRLRSSRSPRSPAYGFAWIRRGCAGSPASAMNMRRKWSRTIPAVTGFSPHCRCRISTDR